MREPAYGGMEVIWPRRNDFPPMSSERIYGLRDRPTLENWKNRVYDLSRETALLQEPPTPEALRALASKMDSLVTFLFETANRLEEK